MLAKTLQAKKFEAFLKSAPKELNGKYYGLVKGKKLQVGYTNDTVFCIDPYSPPQKGDTVFAFNGNGTVELKTFGFADDLLKPSYYKKFGWPEGKIQEKIELEKRRRAKNIAHKLIDVITLQELNTPAQICVPDPKTKKDIKKILVVDDDDPFRELTEYALEAKGFDPIMAPCPEEAMKILRKESDNIDIVYIDVFFGEKSQKSGFVLADEIRKDPKINTPYYLMSMLPTNDSRRKALQVNALGFIEKDIDNIIASLPKHS